MNEQKHIWAVVPVKSFARAKARLAGPLDSAQREQLARAMLEDVLTGFRKLDGLSGILVVSADTQAREIARAYGARTIDDPFESGPNEAIQLALPFLQEIRADAMIVVPSDVPQIEPDELLPIVQCLSASSVALVAALRDGGTNLLGCAPIDVICPCFGVNSFAKHVDEARRAGVEPNIVTCPSIMDDIDQPQDLSRFRARHRTKTGACLDRWSEETQMFNEAVLAQ
jgi:2-phospho-L-lactate guanylyltransferase